MYVIPTNFRVFTLGTVTRVDEEQLRPSNELTEASVDGEPKLLLNAVIGVHDNPLTGMSLALCTMTSSEFLPKLCCPRCCLIATSVTFF